MTILKKFLYLVFILLLSGSCNKIELPEPDEGDPVFILEGSLDSLNLALTAGVDDYYLFTSFERDAIGIHTFYGNLRKEDCLGCGPAFRIGIRDFQAVTGDEVNPQIALAPGSYEFYTLNQPLDLAYRMAFTPSHFSSEMNEAALFLWEFGDGQQSDEKNPVHTYPDSSDYEVCLQVIDESDCVSDVCGTVSFFPNTPLCSADFTITPVYQGTLGLQFSANVQGGVQPFTYSWNTGQTTASFFYSVQADSSDFEQTFCLNLIDANACNTEICKDVIVTFNSPALPFQLKYCSSDFTYEPIIDTLSLSDPLQLSTVFLAYVDEQGRVFRSDQGPQEPSTAHFTILSAETYDPNENGQPTFLLELEAGARLYDEDGNSVLFNSSRLVWAVAHP